jgi:2-iminobutanoate/2-iminopropanoate deaminase
MRGKPSRERNMPKKQIVSSKIRQPSGHFSHATMIEAKGRLVFRAGLKNLNRTISGVSA